MTFETDIVLAGGGVSGLTCALALAQTGWRVTICDALPADTRAAPEFDGRAYAIAGACQAMLRVLGIWQDIEHQTQPMHQILVTEGDSDRVPGPGFLHFDAMNAGSGTPAHMVEDGVLRASLAKAVSAHPEITQLAPARIVSESVEGARVRVETAEGASISAQMLIICDGRASQIAQRAGIHYLRRDYDQSGLVGAIEHERPHDGVAHEFFLPPGPFAILPLTGNRSSLVWTETRDEAARIHALDENDYADELRLRIGDFLGEIKPVGRRYTYPLGMALAERYFAARRVVLGDAAHAIHPLAGQGLNLSLKDVAALAEVLSDARRRGEDIGSDAVLLRYQDWRRFEANATGLSCDALNAFFTTRMPMARPLRQIGLGLVNALPGVKRSLIDSAAGISGDLPRLLRGEAL